MKSKRLRNHAIFAFIAVVHLGFGVDLVSAENSIPPGTPPETATETATDPATDASPAPAPTQATTDTARSWGVAPLPIIAYSPDTGGMFGAAAILFYGPDVGVPEDQRQGIPNNTASINGIITTNGSYIGALSTTNYLDEGTYRWDNSFFGQRAPGVYYGIGSEADDEEHYEADAIGGSTRFLVETAPDLYVGPAYRFQRLTVTETDDDGVLRLGEENGSSGTSIASGIGGVIVWDTTGGAFWPTGGHLGEVEMYTFPKAIGSTATYGLYNIKYTEYISIGESHVVALQGRVGGSWGAVPFYDLPSIGGDGVLRGVLAGRYRDTIVAVAQGEYRWQCTDRFGVVAFGSVGQVGKDIASLDLADPQFAGGLGFRVAINKEQRVNLRIDIAVSPYGVAPYVSMGEAF